MDYPLLHRFRRFWRYKLYPCDKDFWGVVRRRRASTRASTGASTEEEDLDRRRIVVSSSCRCYELAVCTFDELR